jgi:hypothetical protein
LGRLSLVVIVSIVFGRQSPFCAGIRPFPPFAVVDAQRGAGDPDNGAVAKRFDRQVVQNGFAIDGRSDILPFALSVMSTKVSTAPSITLSSVR